MEKILLKDMPEHMEKIENSYSLQSEIRDCLVDFEQTFEDDGFNISAVHEDDYKDVSQLILAKIADFVNQNYEWKGVKQ